MKKFIVILASMMILSSCTQNERVKRFGGSATIDIPADRQFVNVTWKENDLWVVTKTRTTSDTLRNVYQLQESSSWGILEGTYTINETR